LSAAQANDWLHTASIVVFPEYIGTWLVAAGEDDSIFMADSLETAVKRMIRTNLLKFAKTLLRAQSKNKIVDAIFRMKADEMARIYQETFSRLAQKYQVTIVAGSIVLPEPEIRPFTKHQHRLPTGWHPAPAHRPQNPPRASGNHISGCRPPRSTARV
jgi:hypothetical protein